jgi:hypothetical protein
MLPAIFWGGTLIDPRNLVWLIVWLVRRQKVLCWRQPLSEWCFAIAWTSQAGVERASQPLPALQAN